MKKTGTNVNPLFTVCQVGFVLYLLINLIIFPLFNHFLYVEFQIVFVVFTPSLVFTSLDEGVTLQDIISW